MRDSMITDNVIAHIRSELYKQNMEHRQLAKMLGISGAYLSDILTGRRTGLKAQEHVKHAMAILGIKKSEVNA